MCLSLSKKTICSPAVRHFTWMFVILLGLEEIFFRSFLVEACMEERRSWSGVTAKPSS